MSRRKLLLTAVAPHAVDRKGKVLRHNISELWKELYLTWTGRLMYSFFSVRDSV